MKHKIFGAMTALAALCASAPFSAAQTPPEQIRDLAGLSYLGVVGGLEAWSVDGSDALWMRAPDGRSLIRGDMFSAAGRDMGAALLGRPEVRAGGDDTASDPAPDWSAPSADLLYDVMQLTSQEAFSLLFGDPEAPPVWAWMDLSSPATPATYMMLRDRVEAGEISLRVVPVVTMEPGSADLMRRLLLSPDPVAALRDRIAGLPGTSLEDATGGMAEQMPAELVARIEGNGALAGRIAPPALPLLLWARADGPAGILGIPGEDVFDGVVSSAAIPQTGVAGPRPD
jgi:hypothetical protein